VIHVCGAGGIGKSTLVRAMADDHTRAGGRIVYVERPIARRVSTVFRRVHDAFGAPADAHVRPSAILERLHRLLANGPPTVIVLDGVDGHRKLMRGLVELWEVERFLAVLVLVSREPDVVVADRRLRLRPLDADGAFACARAHAAGMADGREIEGREALATIARACAGHPLAIELAVARLRARSAADVVDWLRRRSRGTRDRIKGAVEELYAELPASDRRALMLLAALHAPPPVALVEHLFRVEGSPSALASLSAAGVVWLRAHGPPTSREGRVWAHDAFLHLAERERDESVDRTFASRIRRAIVEFGETLVDEFGRVRSEDALPLLWAIRPHLEMVLEEERPNGVWGRAALLANAAFDVAISRRRSALLTRALNAIDHDDALGMRLRLARARAVIQHNDLDAALADLAAARAAATAGGSHEGLVLAWHIDALCRIHLGEFGAAAASARRTIDLAEGRDPKLACEARVNLAHALHLRGDHDGAAENAERALAMASALSDPRLIAYAAQQSAGIHIDTGDAAMMERLCILALRAARRARNATFVAVALRGLGCLEILRGRSSRAIRLLRRAEATFRRLDIVRGRAHTLIYLGVALIAAGDGTAGLDTLGEALDSGIAHQHVPLALSFVALARYRAGDAEGAHDAMEKARRGLSEDAGFARTVVEWVSDVIAHERRTATARVDAEGRGTDREPLEIKLLRTIADGVRAPSVSTASRRVALSGAWFVAYDGRVVSLARRPALQRLVAALARGARAGEGPLRHVRLHDASWPGEAASDAIARNRVRVAVWALRQLGFGGLESSRAGYWLEDRNIVDDCEPEEGLAGPSARRARPCAVDASASRAARAAASR
jgi:tetratricopeptide (TPR) repeat protein